MSTTFDHSLFAPGSVTYRGSNWIILSVNVRLKRSTRQQGASILAQGRHVMIRPIYVIVFDTLYSPLNSFSSIQCHILHADFATVKFYNSTGEGEGNER